MYIFNDSKLTTQEIYEIVYRKRKVKVADDSTSRVQKSFDFLMDYAKDNLVYGVNTGFGPMAQYMVPAEESKQLQFNLIRSHSAGSGEILSPNLTRAILLARLNTLAQGYSGINPRCIELLCELLNHEIYPVIYAHGGVGASGDLVQLSHVALALIGEGRVWYNGKIRSTPEVFEPLGIEPLKIDLREGLALINGTAAMNGIGFSNYFSTKKLVDWVLVFSSMLYEVLGVFDDFYSTNLNDAKQHWGQSQIARNSSID